MTLLNKAILDTYRSVVRSAAPGPWLDGNWFTFCHKQHKHNFQTSGDDACEPVNVFSPGGRLVSAGTADEPVTVIGNVEYDGVTISEENKRFIVFFNPAVVSEMLDTLEAVGASANLDSPEQLAKSRRVKSLLRKVISKDETEVAAIHETGAYIAELEQAVRTLKAQLAGHNG
jgi:hypothetical protein